MRTADRLIELVTERSRVVIAVFLVVTLLVGSGVIGIEQSSSLDQFQTDSEEADKQAYIDENFGGEDNATTAQLIVREENALSKESLIGTLELQQELRANETINETLAEEPFGDLSNVIATTAIREDRADGIENRSGDLEERSEELEARGDELERQQAQLEEEQAAVESRGEFMVETLNETRELRIAYDSDEISRIEYENGLDELDGESRDRLPDEEYAAFAGLIDEVADAQAELNALEAQRETDEITEAEYEAKSEESTAEIESAYDAIESEVLAEASADLEARGDELEAESEQLEADTDTVAEEGDRLDEEFESISEIDPSTDEQIEQLESMNQSEIDEVSGTVLDEDASNEVFVFLPTDYEPGSTTADARAVLVTQTAEDDAVIEGEAPQTLVDSQLAMSEIGEDETLERLADAEDQAAASDATVTLPSGEADVRSPLSVMESVAEEDEEFNETFTTADTTGDGVPDTDVEGVYDALFEADSGAAEDVIHRTGAGEYESFRLVISVQGSASADAATEETRAVAAVVDGDGLEATATGQPIVFGIVEDELLETVIESMLVTLIAVFVFLMLAYRWVNDSAILGAVTLLPIVFSVAWILGTMALLDVPFNVMTGTITSLTIGLGVAYNIHMTERFLLERERGRDTRAALERAVTGTGGALLGSAATTVGGFGVLVFAILPPLQQFGLITGLTIVYAFLGSVFVLPSLLVVWARYLGPDRERVVETETATPAGSD